MRLKNNIMNIINIIFLSLSYWTIDIGIRYLSYESYKFYNFTKIAPNLFSLGWITLFIAIFYLINPKKRKIFYIITLIFFNLIGISQYLHFKILERFYSISDLFLIKEGSKYLGFALFKIDIKILTVTIISLLFGLISIKINKKYHETYRDKLYFSFLIIFSTICAISFHFCGYYSLETNAKNSYDESFTPTSIYKEFNNPNKNMQIVGMYENISRGIIVHINKNSKNNIKETTNKIENHLKEQQKTLKTNNYTGIFKNKNIIVILAESLDHFIINEKTMPTLYRLSNEGLNFTNRYSPAFGGGQTINSEFAINTGLYSSLEGNIFNSNNTYKNSLANKFKSIGYDVNSIHFNSGYYYNRSDFHKNLGYDNHYALLDMEDIEHNKYDYEFDSNLIANKKVSDLIVKENKFLTFITTYSLHLPYNATNNKCKSSKYGFIVSKNEELSCIYNLAYDTDLMIKLLIEKLEKENKLQDTVLVIASDHYMFGYSKIKEVKNTDNSYLIQNTPLIIWNSEIEHQNIETLVDTADILPTILNLFDIEYDPNLYVGEDAFSLNRDNYIYFTEDIYYKDNQLFDSKKNTGEVKIYNKIKKSIEFNNNLIKTNYLKTR